MQLITYLLSMFAIIFPALSSANSLAPTKTGGSITSLISMVVADVTCRLDDGRGSVNQQIFMPLVSISDLINNKGGEIDIPLFFNCQESQIQPEDVSISINPTGVSTIVSDGRDGKLRTNKSGVGILLLWKHSGQPVNLVERELVPEHKDNVWDLSIAAKTIAIEGNNVSGGEYRASVTINARYY